MRKSSDFLAALLTAFRTPTYCSFLGVINLDFFFFNFYFAWRLLGQREDFMQRDNRGVGGVFFLAVQPLCQSSI